MVNPWSCAGVAVEGHDGEALGADTMGCCYVWGGRKWMIHVGLEKIVPGTYNQMAMPSESPHLPGANCSLVCQMV